MPPFERDFGTTGPLQKRNGYENKIGCTKQVVLRAGGMLYIRAPGAVANDSILRRRMGIVLLAANRRGDTFSPGNGTGQL